MPVKKHLGFKKTQAKIAKKQGISKKASGAILASAARKASPAAVKKNPALLNVKRGVKKFVDGGKNNIPSDTNKRFVLNGPILEPSKQSPETMQKSRPVQTKELPKKLGFRKGGKATYSSKTTYLPFAGKNYPTKKSFKATKSGKLISYTKSEVPYVDDSKVNSTKGYTKTSIDTTGYSKGKKSFPANQTKYNPFNSKGVANDLYPASTRSFDVPRNKVEKTIKEMKSNSGMLQKEKAAKLKQKQKAPVSTKTVIDRNGKKTTKEFKPVKVNKSEAFRKGGKVTKSKK